MCRVDSIGVGTSNLGETFKLFLEHGQLRGPTASVVYFLINATKVDTRLIELALQLLQLAINCYSLAFLKAVEKFQLGGGTRCDLLDLVLAKNVCTEYLIAIERNRNRLFLLRSGLGPFRERYGRLYTAYPSSCEVRS